MLSQSILPKGQPISRDYNNIFTVLEQTRKITFLLCKQQNFNDNYKNFNLALFELVYNQKL